MKLPPRCEPTPSSLRTLSQACFFSPGSATRCDAWDVTRVPWWLYGWETIMLWSFSVRLILRSLVITHEHDGRGLGIALTHLQLPVALLVWRELWHSMDPQDGHRSLVHTSLQTGWLHFLLVVRSRMLESVASSLMTSRTQARTAPPARARPALLSPFSFARDCAHLSHGVTEQVTTHRSQPALNHSLLRRCQPLPRRRLLFLRLAAFSEWHHLGERSKRAPRLLSELRPGRLERQLCCV